MRTKVYALKTYGLFRIEIDGRNPFLYYDKKIDFFYSDFLKKRIHCERNGFIRVFALESNYIR